MQAVAGLAYYRLLTVLFDVFAPLLGVALLVGQGAGALSFLLAFLAAVLLLCVLFLSISARKTHPVLGDIPCERATPGANLPFFLLVACLGQWGAILLCIGGGIFVFYASGNLLMAGVVLFLLRLCLLVCRVVILALKR
ncbi:MAG: hypothetical protein IJC99_03730 [Clostridia bacterium]|nr:hypothetical protein [Clostridia bacterium]